MPSGPKRMLMRLEWPVRTKAIRLLSHPIWSHFIPFIPNGTSSWYRFEDVGSAETDGGLPVPPRALYADLCSTKEDFLQSGKRHVEILAEVVKRHQIGKLVNVLDFGCGAGRMTRWFGSVLDCENVFGTDIDSLRASWCVNYLGNYGRFWTSTSHPHLPIADGLFDLIVCGSVFTHIDDLSEAWMMEMARVTKVGGLIYVTLHDEQAIQWLQKNDANAWLLSKARSNSAAYPFLERPSEMPRKLVIGRFNRSQVFYRRDYFVQSISRDFEHIDTVEQGYGFQSALLFRRR